MSVFALCFEICFFVRLLASPSETSLAENETTALKSRITSSIASECQAKNQAWVCVYAGASCTWAFAVSLSLRCRLSAFQPPVPLWAEWRANERENNRGRKKRRTKSVMWLCGLVFVSKAKVKKRGVLISKIETTVWSLGHGHCAQWGIRMQCANTIEVYVLKMWLYKHHKPQWKNRLTHGIGTDNDGEVEKKQ